MTTSNRKKSSPSSASPKKKQNVRVVSEKEMFSPKIFPIDDHWKEKALIELQISDYLSYLWKKKLEAKEVFYSPEALYHRIREVYRLCLESKENEKEKMKVINDFVSFHPKLVFDTPWLADLVKKHTTFEDPGDSSPRTKLLEALGAGFRRAAYPKVRVNRQIRSMKVNWGKALVESFKGELRTFYKSEDWVHGTRKEAVSKKLEELIERYTCLKKCRKELSEHLLHWRVSATAQLIASKVLRVRLHDLKSKAKWQL